MDKLYIIMPVNYTKVIMKIKIASDHVGLELKQQIIERLTTYEIEVNDYGTNDNIRVDYPDYAKKVTLEIVGTNDLGILVCGTGVGMSIVANKQSGIRAVVCSDPYSAKLSREHNDTNVLCLGARVVGIELAMMIIDNWLSGQFEGGRHQLRINKMEE